MSLATRKRDEKDRLVAGLRTKSDKIRALGRAGYARQEIADYLDIRYQHVRNVLVAEAAKTAREGDVLERAPSPAGDAWMEWVQVGPDGRVVIPAALRQRLGIEAGGPLLLAWSEGEARLTNRQGAMRWAQALVAGVLPAGGAVVDDFLLERRAEAARESATGESDAKESVSGARRS